MSATATRAKAGAKWKAGERAARRRKPLVVRDWLSRDAVFSVLPTREEGVFTVEGGSRILPGAVASFTATADLEPDDLAGRGHTAVIDATGWRSSTFTFTVTMPPYPGGQALFVAGKVGAVLKLCELCGRPWPAAACLDWLGYPMWLIEQALEEYSVRPQG